MRINKSRVYKYGGKTFLDIRVELEPDRCDIKEDEARLKKNLPWLLPYMLNWAYWDYYYTIELFTECLWQMGRGITDEKVFPSVNHIKRGRRAMQASKMLHHAYNYETYMDKSYAQLQRNNPIKFEKVGNGKYSQLVHDYKPNNAMSMDPRIYYEKMFRIINKRQDEKEDKLKKDAWDFLNKHICTFWE
jgi:hypothetical protein